MASERAALAKRAGAVALAVAALVFAIQGGEFGTSDLIRQSRERAQIKRTVDSLRRVIDSLTRYENSVQHDPATQERIAREIFGMVRGDKEVVYRIQP